MAINPDLFECVVCNVQPAQYFDFKATSAGAAYRAAYDARAGNGFTGAQRFVDDPDSAPLCSTHHRLAEKRLKWSETRPSDSRRRVHWSTNSDECSPSGRADRLFETIMQVRIGMYTRVHHKAQPNTSHSVMRHLDDDDFVEHVIRLMGRSYHLRGDRTHNWTDGRPSYQTHEA